MLDIMLCRSGDHAGDLELTDDGDIRLGSSIRQNVQIALSWILGEWRLGPDIGFPWYEEIWVKNPNLDLLKQEITTAILNVDGVTSVEVEIMEYDKGSRTLTFSFSCTSDDEESYSEEVTISG